MGSSFKHANDRADTPDEAADERGGTPTTLTPTHALPHHPPTHEPR